MIPLLELEHVTYAYHSKNGEVCALSDISFQIQKAGFVAVVGPSGCGKSTLLSLIAGLLSRRRASLYLFYYTAQGKEKKRKDCTKERKKTQTGIRKDTGYMLQRDHLFEWRTIYQNVILGLEIQHRLNEKTEARVEKMLRDYGLWRFRNAHPSELSGGMRQRAALIRTLAPGPRSFCCSMSRSPHSIFRRGWRSVMMCAAILRKEQKTAILVTA